MRNTAIISLLAMLLMLAGCSRKETFYFSESVGSFLSDSKTRTAEPTTLTATRPAPPEEEALAEPDALTAATGPTALELTAPVAATTALTGISLSTQLYDQELHVAGQQEAIAIQPRAYKEASQMPPKDKKKPMVGKVEAGFALSLFGVISIALMLITPYLLYFSGLLTFSGLILSFLGLLELKKKNKKFRGKVRAWVGLLLGLVGTALVVLLLNNKF